MKIFISLLLAGLAVVISGFPRVSMRIKGHTILNMASTLKRQTTENGNVEAARVVVKKIPELNSIRHAANSISRSKASKDFCQKSGGYPNNEVKDSIYTVLMAYSSRAITQSQNIYNYQENCKNCEV